MAWIIESYRGVGKIKLGMNTQEVERELGPPDSVRTSSSHGREEYRALELPMLTYDEAGVSEISFSRQAHDVELLGIHDVFKSNPIDVLRRIEKEDSSLIESMGIIVSKKLGVSLSGFHDSDESQKTVTLFKRGLWDDLTESTHFTLSQM